MVAEFMHVLLALLSILKMLHMYLAILWTLSCRMGFPLIIIIEDACFSDHKPIVFNVTVYSFLGNIKTTGCYTRCFNSLTVKSVFRYVS